jgi:hypothetical protein
MIGFNPKQTKKETDSRANGGTIERTNKERAKTTKQQNSKSAGTPKTHIPGPKVFPSVAEWVEHARAKQSRTFSKPGRRHERKNERGEAG